MHYTLSLKIIYHSEERLRLDRGKALAMKLTCKMANVLEKELIVSEKF